MSFVQSLTLIFDSRCEVLELAQVGARQCDHKNGGGVVDCRWADVDDK